MQYKSFSSAFNLRSLWKTCFLCGYLSAVFTSLPQFFFFFLTFAPLELLLRIEKKSPCFQIIPHVYLIYWLIHHQSLFCFHCFILSISWGPHSPPFLSHNGLSFLIPCSAYSSFHFLNFGVSQCSPLYTLSFINHMLRTSRLCLQ